MKIGFLGIGSWGFCLAHLLASKGYEVISWSRSAGEVTHLKEKRYHPRFLSAKAFDNMDFTNDMALVLEKADLIVEAVTAAGVRPVFEQVKTYGIPKCPVVLTSKGIEQNTELLLSEVLLDVLGTDAKNIITCLSGPSLAEEVIRQMPTSVVAAGYDVEAMNFVRDTFTTGHFRVYSNSDVLGVQFGGAMKNIMAIACGISDGLGYGDNTRAALMTRGLHEMRRLAETKHARPETLNGLSGMGDLGVTCTSSLSRNFRYGNLIGKGMPPEQARERIGAVVEGAYSAVSAMQLAKDHHIIIPITQAIYQVIYEKLPPLEAVKQLMVRAPKEELL
ncbi:MAG: NAD(P)H-dependent glycerol-3-phosphate dehydrogenase [Chlamydiota bacterium]